MKRYYSSGKLLLTGEYAVLDGALCLALPTKYGQELQLGPISDPIIRWTSKDHDQSIWFEEVISMDRLQGVTPKPVSGMSTSEALIQVLGIARQMNPDFLSGDSGFNVVTQLEFPRKWGLGTSSTLINNIAQWAKVDPYALLERTFGGSGYDIACAQHRNPLFYQLKDGKPRVASADFKPSFASSLFFVYLNRKQDSREAIKNYREQTEGTAKLVEEISALTKAIAGCARLQDFEALLNRHELLIAEALNTPTVKKRLFPDYPYLIKSLGAWGGDFILVVGGETDQAYFHDKGYTTIIPYSDMIA